MKKSLCLAAFFGILSLAFSNTLQAQDPSSESINPPKAPSRLESVDPNTPGIRFALGGGYAYRLGKELPNTSSYIQDLTDQLRHGYNIGGELHYVFYNGLGVGVTANFVQSSLSTRSSLTEHQNIIYVGPSMLWRADGQKAAFIGAIGAGGLFLSDKITSGRQSGKITGSTFGAHASIGGECKLSPATAIGLKVAVNIGSIKTLKSGGQSTKLDDGWSASSLMITAFISFRSQK